MRRGSPGRRAGAWWWLAAVCSLGPVSPVSGSHDCYVPVSQPIHVGDCGCYVIGGATYRVMCSWLPPGYGVTLIGRPNRVMADDVPEQRNAAYDAGLKITADLAPDASVLPRRDGSIYLDTLSVTLDVAEALARTRAGNERYRADRDSAAASMAASGDTAMARRIRQSIGQFVSWQESMVPRLVQATLDCILDTAAQDRIPIHHVRVTIVGDPGLAGMSATRAVQRRSPPAREY